MAIHLKPEGENFWVDVTPPHAEAWRSDAPLTATEVLGVLAEKGCHSTDIMDALSETDSTWVERHDAELRRRRQLVGALTKALTHLAAGPQQQEQYLRRAGTWPSLDELALELDDVEGAVVWWLSREAAGPIRRLSKKLDSMSGGANSRLWQPDALRGPDWCDVRRLAADALAELRAHS